MDYRDQFALAAMQSILANREIREAVIQEAAAEAKKEGMDPPTRGDAIAGASYFLADCMMLGAGTSLQSCSAKVSGSGTLTRGGR